MDGKVTPVKEITVDHLQVRVYKDRKTMGLAAGNAVADRLRELLKKQDSVTMVFAAAPSQNELLATLVHQADIDWKRVIAFHMDEYVGLPEDSPQLFRRYLKDHIFDLVDIGQVHYLNPNTDSTPDECRRYAGLLRENPVDIVCCGIGENGHLAFNDPPVADFLDPEIVKVVELDETCRQQQVNDGCFPSLAQVPAQAMTLTIPALLSGRYIHCVVPGTTKATAVRDTLYGPVTTACPASILRRHFRANLYLDPDSAARL